MSDVAIRVENISKRYTIGNTSNGSLRETIVGLFSKNSSDNTEEFYALRDVSFEVKRGEAMGIIGKNGAGKSTLLKILSRITEPTSGRIEIDGRVSSLLEVGTGFHPELTGRENVFLNGTILGMTRTEVKRKFDEIVDFSGVEKFLDTPVKRYSSGMKVRLAFAVAAHLEPEILIIDEVLAVGDAEFQKKCLGKMEDVTEEGRTVLFVSHNMGAVVNLCKRGLLLSEGKVVFNGNTDKAIEKYLDIHAKYTTIFKFDNPLLDRMGNEYVKFKQLSITNGEVGNEIIYPLHNIHIELDYTTKEGFDPKRTEITIILKDSNGSPVTSFSTRFNNSKFDFLSNKGKVVCNIPKLNVLPGQYSLYLWCGTNSEIYDLIKNAGYINVVEKDIFDNGFLPPASKYGYSITEHYWTLN